MHYSTCNPASTSFLFRMHARCRSRGVGPAFNMKSVSDRQTIGRAERGSRLTEAKSIKQTGNRLIWSDQADRDGMEREKGKKNMACLSERRIESGFDRKSMWQWGARTEPIDPLIPANGPEKRKTGEWQLEKNGNSEIWIVEIKKQGERECSERWKATMTYDKRNFPVQRLFCWWKKSRSWRKLCNYWSHNRNAFKCINIEESLYETDPKYI